MVGSEAAVWDSCLGRGMRWRSVAAVWGGV